MFRNYVTDPSSRSPLNLAFARVLLSAYLLWKVLSARWERIHLYPRMRDRPAHLDPFVPEAVLVNVELLAGLTVLALVLFAAGVYLRYTAFVASFLVCYFGVLHATVDWSWSTQMFFPASMLLMLYALYAEQDRFSIDGVRRRSADGVDELNRHLKTPLTPRYRSTPLLVFLLALGVVYFGAATGKLAQSGLEWVGPTNQGRYLHDHLQRGYVPQIHAFVAQYDVLLLAGGVGTLIAQFGLLVSTLTGKLFGVFVLTLLGFHVATAVVMGPVFVYTVVFFLLFVDWETLVARLESDAEIDLIYDERCRFCLQALFFFRYLDVKDGIAFYSQSDVPPEHLECAKVGGDVLYLLRDGRTYEGYRALGELCRYLGVLYPLYVLSRVPLLSTAGERLYGYVTTDRSEPLVLGADDGRSDP